MLFRIQGRANRAQYWGYGVLLPLLMIIIVGVLVAVLMPLLQDSSTGDDIVKTVVAVVVGLIGLVTLVLTVWMSIAVGVKRFHDMNQSGWLYALAFIPYLGTLVVIVIGILKGTDGENQYGDIPTPVE